MKGVEVPLGTSSGCRWVCPLPPRWTARTTQARRTSTLFPSRGSRAGWIASLLPASETWWWPLSRRGSQIWGRRSCPQSSSGSGSRGAERTACTCISKVLLLSLVSINPPPSHTRRHWILEIDATGSRASILRHFRADLHRHEQAQFLNVDRFHLVGFHCIPWCSSSWSNFLRISSVPISSSNLMAPVLLADPI